MMPKPAPISGSKENLAHPPRLIGSLRSGFDTVSRNIGLILFPVVLDLFLWLGPRYQLKSVFLSIMREIESLPGIDSPEMVDLLAASQRLWAYMADHFNLASFLRTYPIGIPSLMAMRMPGETPLGIPGAVDLTRVGSILIGWLVFALAGMLLGSFYFNGISRAATRPNPEGAALIDLWPAGQTVLLALLWIVLLLIINLPAFLLLSLLAVVSPGIAQMASLLYMVLLAWIVVPMLFSPHGIFVYRQNALFSLLSSVRLVRFILPSTGMFFLVLILMSQGLDLLWQVPPSSSWMSLIGIAGHAFVTTSLVAASFVYYHDAVRWVQDVHQRQVIPAARV